MGAERHPRPLPLPGADPRAYRDGSNRATATLRPALLRSTDMGRTWRRMAIVPSDLVGDETGLWGVDGNTLVLVFSARREGLARWTARGGFKRLYVDGLWP